MKDLLAPDEGWIDISPRISLPKSKNQKWLFKLAAKASKWMGRESVPDIFILLSINSSLFWPWLHFASKLMPYGKLSVRTSELVILRVAWLCRCKYEWGQHIELGQKRAQLSDLDVLAVTKGASYFQNEEDICIMLACDELIKNNMIGQETWDLLEKQYQPTQLIELQMLIGHYAMLAGVLNSSGLKLEDNIESNLQKFYERVK